MTAYTALPHIARAKSKVLHAAYISVECSNIDVSQPHFTRLSRCFSRHVESEIDLHFISDYRVLNSVIQCNRWQHTTISKWCHLHSEFDSCELFIHNCSVSSCLWCHIIVAKCSYSGLFLRFCTGMFLHVKYLRHSLFHFLCVHWVTSLFGLAFCRAFRRVGNAGAGFNHSPSSCLQALIFSENRLQISIPGQNFKHFDIWPFISFRVFPTLAFR